MTTPTKTPILNKCAKCGTYPQMLGMKHHGHVWHSVTCPNCGKCIPQVVSLSAAVSWWNEENGSVKEVQL